MQKNGRSAEKPWFIRLSGIFQFIRNSLIIKVNIKDCCSWLKYFWVMREWHYTIYSIYNMNNIQHIAYQKPITHNIYHIKHKHHPCCNINTLLFLFIIIVTKWQLHGKFARMLNGSFYTGWGSSRPYPYIFITDSIGLAYSENRHYRKV